MPSKLLVDVVDWELTVFLNDYFGSSKRGRVFYNFFFKKGAEEIQLSIGEAKLGGWLKGRSKKNENNYVTVPNIVSITAIGNDTFCATSATGGKYRFRLDDMCRPTANAVPYSLRRIRAIMTKPIAFRNPETSCND